MTFLKYFIDQTVKIFEGKENLKEKIRLFKPTITETDFGKRITWVMRDKPLNDFELNEITKKYL